MTQEKIELTLEPRNVTGKAVKHLRKDGIVPAVIHDHGKDSVVVQGELRAVLKVYQQAGKHHPVALKAGGKNYNAMIKDVEFEPRKHRLHHIVFNAVSATEKVEAEIPLQPRYEEGNEVSPAERAGLMVLTQATTVTVSAVASKLPDVIEYDAEKLVAVGDTVTVADLKAPQGVELVTDETQVIAAVNDPEAIAAANDAAGGDVEDAGAEVPTDNGSPEDDQNIQAAENKPGGKAGAPDQGE
ncbi:MAG TPA: 50S ribosomal protein L25 [Candidatus Saccharimonadales bacterium]|nr:50S ribosomal protein L25 [Candidatus Saccharimonadales bacterium]